MISMARDLVGPQITLINDATYSRFCTPVTPSHHEDTHGSI